MKETNGVDFDVRALQLNRLELFIVNDEVLVSADLVALADLIG